MLARLIKFINMDSFSKNMNKFRALFHNTPIIGMIHLAGNDPVKRALEEIAIYEEEGVDGVIVENYHGSKMDVVKTLEELA